MIRRFSHHQTGIRTQHDKSHMTNGYQPLSKERVAFVTKYLFPLLPREIITGS